jgi:hypothetical protein
MSENSRFIPLSESLARPTPPLSSIDGATRAHHEPLVASRGWRLAQNHALHNNACREKGLAAEQTRGKVCTRFAGRSLQMCLLLRPDGLRLFAIIVMRRAGKQTKNLTLFRLIGLLLARNARSGERSINGKWMPS